ncbi:MAG: dTDP-4-dehydrorhamnose 3,5-epimerase [Deltaproteobacteria bacterium]|nr:dTDP-4-dehydrorhamnose 3,5-epimerase [Deltaproteobacteria bacterium]
MRIIPTELPEVLIVEPTVHRDDRGFFLETWHAQKFADAGLPARFVQDNHSSSRRGTLRGLHAQLARPQGKLVRASLGEIFDVAVDIRRGSPRFGRSVGVVLSAESFRQLWIPEGFAHGFCVLSEDAEIQYKCTDFYDPSSELTIAWDDPALGIPWPAVGPPLLSAKDRSARSLAQFAEDELPHFPGQGGRGAA